MPRKIAILLGLSQAANRRDRIFTSILFTLTLDKKKNMYRLLFVSIFVSFVLFLLIRNYLKIMEVSLLTRLNMHNRLEFGDIVLFKSNLAIQLLSNFKYTHVAMSINENFIIELLPSSARKKNHVTIRPLLRNEKYFVRRLMVGNDEQRPGLAELNRFFEHKDKSTFQYSHVTYIKECIHRITQQVPLFIPISCHSVKYNNCATFIAEILVFLGIFTNQTKSQLPDNFAEHILPTTRSFKYGPILEH